MKINFAILIMVNFMNMFFIAQIFGVFALLFWLCSVLQTKRSKILTFQNLANIFYASQYTLLGAFPATCMNLVSTLRGLVFYSNDKKNKTMSIWVLLVFIILIAVIGLFTYQNIYSLIPLIITALYSYSVWQKKLIIFRIIFIIGAIGWIIYNSIVGAYVSLIGNFFELTFGIIAFVKNDIKK